MQKIGAILKSPNRYQQLSTIAFAICVSIRYGIIDYSVQKYELNLYVANFVIYKRSDIDSSDRSLFGVLERPPAALNGHLSDWIYTIRYQIAT